MVLDFVQLPPEVNSARIFAGAGSGPLHLAAAAWDGLAEDLQASATSFESVITQLTSGPWSGPASLSMAAAATPYLGWLSSAAIRAACAATQARVAATAFESAVTATVHPLAVTTNRTTLSALLATNFFGMNAPAIAATEFQYMEMWAQDVAAMVGYHTGATSVASTITSFEMPSLSLTGLTSLGSQASSALSGLESSTGLTSLVSQASSALSGVTSSTALSSLESEASSAISGLTSSTTLSDFSEVAQIGMYPASMMMSPMMSLAQMGHSAVPALTGAELGADGPELVKTAVPDMNALGGGGGVGSVATGGLGNARLVGALSVPPTWEGSMPGNMASTAMSGLGAAGVPNASEMAGAAGSQMGSGGMPMMPMPTGMGAGTGAPGGMIGRGGASPHATDNRPSVIPRTGIG